MSDLAISLCRVSTPEQRDSNSLNRQEIAVREAAAELKVEIIKYWSGDVSSKAGTNVTRKDLKEMYDFCKTNKQVKFLIVDEPDRFMRSTEEAPYWEITFKLIGVTVWYASDLELNKQDMPSKLMKYMKFYQAEASNEERQRKSINGHVAAIKDGRYTFPPKPGYMKGAEPGVHIPHPITYKPLEKAFKEVLSGLHTPLEAMKRLNASEFNKARATWNMDKFRQFATDPYYAGILVIDKQVNVRNEHGLHKAMLTRDEHEELVRIFTGRFKPHGPHKQYNPDFPMNKIMVCEDCGGAIKFTGSKRNNGYNRKTTTEYYKYECRGCHRSYHRLDVHNAISERLSEVKYIGSQHVDFVTALETVWQQKQQDKLQEVKVHQKRLEQLQKDKSNLVVALAGAEVDMKQDIKTEIDRTKLDIADVEDHIRKLSELDKDLVQFVDFGLNYTNDLMEDWWDLEHDDRVRCQLSVFPAGISFNSHKKVGTSQISPLYSLKPTKKDLSIAEKSLMVELEGIAPSSASLSWLGFYRHRLFECLRNMAGK